MEDAVECEVGDEDRGDAKRVREQTGKGWGVGEDGADVVGGEEMGLFFYCWGGGEGLQRVQRLWTGELVGVGLDDAGVDCVGKGRRVERRRGADVEGIFFSLGEDRQKVEGACEVAVAVA